MRHARFAVVLIGCFVGSMLAVESCSANGFGVSNGDKPTVVRTDPARAKTLCVWSGVTSTVGTLLAVWGAVLIGRVDLSSDCGTPRNASR
jgi:hypothetical protein